MQYRSKSVTETQMFAAKLAAKVSAFKRLNRATVIALEGELGAGKTTFVKAFAKALGVKQHITSPTFVLMKSFTLHASRFTQLVHIDAYRLKDHRDLLPLGIKALLAAPGNLILIEWAERVVRVLPKKHITVHMDHIDEHTRQITIK